MAVCVAIIGKDVSGSFLLQITMLLRGKLQVRFVFQNSPKYITCLNPDEELSFQYKALSSLDFVEEKLSKGGSDLRELYLGMLYSLETHKV